MLNALDGMILGHLILLRLSSLKQKIMGFIGLMKT
jgi:hypothetical protein